MGNKIDTTRLGESNCNEDRQTVISEKQTHFVHKTAPQTRMDFTNSKNKYILDLFMSPQKGSREVSQLSVHFSSFHHDLWERDKMIV
jgi:hypothetical protein